MSAIEAMKQEIFRSLALAILLLSSNAFHSELRITRPYSLLLGAKKFGNKQADLQEKLRQAKAQNQNNGDDNNSSSLKGLSDTEVKEENDRKRFAELLERRGSLFDEYSNDSYLNTAQEEEEMQAARKLSRFDVFVFCWRNPTDP